MYAGGKDASLTGEHTPRCVCGYVIGHAYCGKARRETELIVLCNGIVARVPAIHDRCVTCLEKPAKGGGVVSNEGKTKGWVSEPSDKAPFAGRSRSSLTESVNSVLTTTSGEATSAKVIPEMN